MNGPGCAIESATSRVEVMAVAAEDAEPQVELEEVAHGHVRRVTPLVSKALDRAGIRPQELRWVATDLGPGSFTGVRVGLATAEALALASGASIVGVSSLASLALSRSARRKMLVPLVPAGRRDLYAGFFRADARGVVSLMAAPRVGPLSQLLAAVEEARGLVGSSAVEFLGPGAGREREALESAYPGSTRSGWRFEGLSARDLADAGRSPRGLAGGLPAQGEETRPLYVRSAQAEERVRHRVTAADPVTLRPFGSADMPIVARIEREVFSDPWPESFFEGELAQPMVYARIAEKDGELVGYSVAWLGAGTGHLGNLAVIPSERRRGIAGLLLRDLLDHAERLGIGNLTLEVRVSNFPAQALYRAYGFRLAGLRRSYYRDTGEDALLMEWRGSGRSDPATTSREAPAREL